MCSSCREPLQAISQPEGDGDDLYCMSLSLMPDIIKIGRSKCPMQRAIELQTSMCFWVYPSIVWLRRGEDEQKVHEQLRQYRIENAPSREYFKIPLKQGSDIVEHTLYADNAETKKKECNTTESLGRVSESIQSNNKKRKLVMCARCQRIQATVNDVQTTSTVEHLFLVEAPFAPGVVGVFHSSDPHKHIDELDLPGKLTILTIWYGRGEKHNNVRQSLHSFRADCPGGNWFHMTPKPASAVITKILFGLDDDGEADPGIIELNVEDTSS